MQIVPVSTFFKCFLIWSGGLIEGYFAMLP